METTFIEWKKQGEKLVHRLNAHEEGLELSQWRIGDWLVQGEKEFHEKTYEAAEAITGWSRGTLYNVVWAVGKFPTSSLRSETKLKWSHFKELARIKDKKLREETLQDFSDGHTYSVIEVREQVDKILRKNENGATPPQQKSFVSMQVSLNLAFRKQVKDLAKMAAKRPDVLLRELVERYFDEYKAEITRKINRKKAANNSKVRKAA
jgi:hypothetical protein